MSRFWGPIRNTIIKCWDVSGALIRKANPTILSLADHSTLDPRKIWSTGRGTLTLLYSKMHFSDHLSIKIFEWSSLGEGDESFYQPNYQTNFLNRLVPNLAVSASSSIECLSFEAGFGSKTNLPIRELKLVRLINNVFCKMHKFRPLISKCVLFW